MSFVFWGGAVEAVYLKIEVRTIEVLLNLGAGH